RDANQSFDAMALAVTVVTGIIFVITLVFYLIVQERAAAAKKQDYPFPAKLLAVASAITLATILWASGSSFYINHRMTADIREDMAISHMGSKIAYLDTMLARALRMTVITADPKWEAIYKDNLRISNQTISDLEDATSDKNAGADQDDLEIYHVAQRID